MNDAEFKAAMEVERRRHTTEKRDIRRHYAMINSAAFEGDIAFTDEGRILVESISVIQRYGDDFPYCVYYGGRLKLDLTPFKGVSKASISQCDVTKVIKAGDL